MELPSTKGGSVGHGENFWTVPSLDTAESHSGLGRLFETSLDRLAIGAAMAALALGAWELIKRYPGPSALYAAAIVAVIAFKM